MAVFAVCLHPRSSGKQERIGCEALSATSPSAARASAEPRSGEQARLDKIVVQIAANMVAEVCSVYVLRADQRLELYATEGLNA
jgi:hypothetical protein